MDIVPDLSENVLAGERQDLGTAVMRADLDAGIAVDTERRVIGDGAFVQGERLRGTVIDTDATVVAQVYRFGIMTVQAVEITALQKDGHTVSRAIYTAERYDLVYLQFIHHHEHVFPGYENFPLLQDRRLRSVG